MTLTTSTSAALEDRRGNGTAGGQFGFARFKEVTSASTLSRAALAGKSWDQRVDTVLAAKREAHEAVLEFEETYAGARWVEVHEDDSLRSHHRELKLIQSETNRVFNAEKLRNELKRHNEVGSYDDYHQQQHQEYCRTVLSDAERETLVRANAVGGPALVQDILASRSEEVAALREAVASKPSDPEADYDLAIAELSEVMAHEHHVRSRYSRRLAGALSPAEYALYASVEQGVAIREELAGLQAKRAELERALFLHNV